jgi:hypothetical protein
MTSLDPNDAVFLVLELFICCLLVIAIGGAINAGHKVFIFLMPFPFFLYYFFVKTVFR